MLASLLFERSLDVERVTCNPQTIACHYQSPANQEIHSATTIDSIAYAPFLNMYLVCLKLVWLFRTPNRKSNPRSDILISRLIPVRRNLSE